MWNLINDLTDAFSQSNPLTHELFSYSKEMKSEGFEKLFQCYDIGITSLNAIVGRLQMSSAE